MFEENSNYGEMNQGIDRITEILKRQSTPVQSSPYQPQASQLPANILNALASASYDYGNGGGDFTGNVQKYQTNQQNQELGQQEALLKTYEMKLKMGDAQTRALDQKLSLFTGDDPEGRMLFLQALHDDPEPIDPSNSYQVMTKLAGIKKRTGYESPDLMMAKQKDQLDIDLKRAQIGATNALASKRNNPTAAGGGFKEANTLRDEFNAQTKDFRTVQDAWSKIQTVGDSPAGDLSLIYATAKLNDPGSVVREADFALQAKAGSFGDRIQNMVSQVSTGNRLTEDQRNNLKSEAKQQYLAQKSGNDRVKGTYTELANKFQIDPSLVITDYTEMAPAEPVNLTSQPNSGIKFLGFE